MTDQRLAPSRQWPGARPLLVAEVIRRLPPGSVVATEWHAQQIRRQEVAMAKTDDEYAAALGARPADDLNIKALDKAEAEAAKAREADRVARFSRRNNRRGGAGPHTGL